MAGFSSLISIRPYPVQVHTYGHECKKNRNRYSEKVTEVAQHIQVFTVVHAHSAEGAAEAMHQVVRQRQASQKVQHHDSRVLKHLIHTQEKIMRLYTVAIAYRLKIFAYTGGPPERADVHN